MKILITGDWHLTDNPNDDYRWNFLDSFLNLSRELKPNLIINLGDLTEKKDKHSSALVNRLVEHQKLLSEVCPNFILKGNHDFLDDPNTPFFKFMKYGIVNKFIVNPTRVGDLLFLPYSLNPKTEWKDLDLKGINKIFAHQGTVGGVYSNGVKEAESEKTVNEDFFKIPVYSGHLHVPQTIGRVTYVGSPHPVDFGDDYDCRILFLNEEKVQSILHKTIKKWSIKATYANYAEIPFNEINAGDQVKFEAYLDKADMDKWSEIKANVKFAIKERGAELCSIELKPLNTPKAQSAELIKKAKNDEEIVFEFAKREKLGYNLTTKGFELITP